MTRAQLFVLGYTLLALLLALPGLYSALQHASHRPLLETIRTHAPMPADSPLAAAMRTTRAALRLSPCHNALHRDLQLLLSNHGDTLAQGDDLVAMDANLAALQQALAASLACRPLDGKTWFDYALISLEREGFAPTAKAALAMSGAVAPRESWLAQKRLALSLTLAPMLDAPLRALALRDLAVLDAANHAWLNALMKATHTHTLEELRARIEQPTTVEEPAP